MATVRIGEKDLDVWNRKTPGSLGMDKKAALAFAAIAEAKGAETHDRVAEAVHCYVGHNGGVTVEWLLSVLPADCGPILRDCIVATGGKVADPGEAKGP